MMPHGQEIIVILMMVVILGIPNLITAIWIYRDASRRGDSNAVAWTIGGLLAWLPVLIIYLALGRSLGDEGRR